MCLRYCLSLSRLRESCRHPCFLVEEDFIDLFCHQTWFAWPLLFCGSGINDQLLIETHTVSFTLSKFIWSKIQTAKNTWGSLKIIQNTVKPHALRLRFQNQLHFERNLIFCVSFYLAGKMSGTVSLNVLCFLLPLRKLEQLVHMDARHSIMCTLQF